MIDYSSFNAFVLSYLESIAPGGVFAILTCLWYLFVDSPRLEKRNWVRLGPFPITHHPLEAVAFFLFGYAFGTDGFPLFALLTILVAVPVAIYPWWRWFKSRHKSKDSLWLTVTTFLVLEVFLTLGYALGL
ncbi:MAG: hypothetical protein ACLP9K_09930 [Nitrososphaerales archaeon]